MKKSKFFIALSISIFVHAYVYGQSCWKPQAMTKQQMEMVSGRWEGSYTYQNRLKSMSVTVSMDKNNHLVCEISNPPVIGRETDREYCICPAGEFHFKKYIGDLSYEFQGVPDNGRMAGTLTVRDKQKTAGTGNFTLSKIE